MDEVRAHVKLTNALDEMLLRRGQIKPEQVRVYDAQALVDTDAVRMVIPVHVMQQLGIAIRRQQVVAHADGRQEAVGVTEPLIVDWEHRDTLQDAVVLGDEVILGQMALEALDVVVDCVNQRLLPNPEHPDQPVSKIK